MKEGLRWFLVGFDGVGRERKVWRGCWCDPGAGRGLECPRELIQRGSLVSNSSFRQHVGSVVEGDCVAHFLLLFFKFTIINKQKQKKRNRKENKKKK